MVTDAQMISELLSSSPRASSHLLGPLHASAQRSAVPLRALVASGALGTWPAAQHRCFHPGRYLGLHFLKTPAQKDGERPRNVALPHVMMDETAKIRGAAEAEDLRALHHTL